MGDEIRRLILFIAVAFTAGVCFGSISGFKQGVGVYASNAVDRTAKTDRPTLAPGT